MGYLEGRHEANKERLKYNVIHVIHMKKMHAIRGIDEETYMKFREKVLAERMKVGEALNIAMNDWMKGKRMVKKGPDAKNLLKLEGIIKSKKKVRWSEEIDEILYGGKT